MLSFSWWLSRLPWCAASLTWRPLRPSTLRQQLPPRPILVALAAYAACPSPAKDVFVRRRVIVPVEGLPALVVLEPAEEEEATAEDDSRCERGSLFAMWAELLSVGSALLLAASALACVAWLAVRAVS